MEHTHICTNVSSRLECHRRPLRRTRVIFHTDDDKPSGVLNVCKVPLGLLIFFNPILSDLFIRELKMVETPRYFPYRSVSVTEDGRRSRTEGEGVGERGMGRGEGIGRKNRGTSAGWTEVARGCSEGDS